ncbi:MAG: RsmB/NOP family class I SAM-dependent RNA methyltransferase [Rhizobiaceae bacterium]|nr:RsmB/NOP family class I SAM-dependent RNA methyltransferase [Rhizobiaceae bacterium]
MMRLGGRLAAAIEILEGLEARPQPSSVALNDWAKAHRFAGSGDRNAIGSLVHDALRNKALNAWRLGAEVGAPETMRFAAWGALLFQWGMDLVELEAVMAGDPHAPDPLDDAARAALASRQPEDAPAYVRVNMSEHLLARFQPAFGDDWERQLAAFGDRPALDLRVNSLKAKRDDVLDALAMHGAVAAPLLASAIRIAPSEGEQRLPNVTAEPVFARGAFEVQDLGSQLVAALVDPEPHSEVLDFCAGAGGKSLAMAAAMGGTGKVHAHDIDRRRLSPLVERAARAGAANITLVERPAQLQPLQGRMARVVVDAPCTGTGTWRRRPDIKWRLSEGNLATRLKEQEQALDAATVFVAPGGRLIYITCSILPEENSAQIKAFRRRHPGFHPIAISALWQRILGVPAKGHALPQGDGSLLTPATTGTDGFFVCVLEKTG